MVFPAQTSWINGWPDDVSRCSELAEQWAQVTLGMFTVQCTLLLFYNDLVSSWHVADFKFARPQIKLSSCVEESAMLIYI